MSYSKIALRLFATEAVDGTLQVVLYILISLMFGEEFWMSSLAVALFCAFLPDYDYPFYLAMIKAGYTIRSHRFLFHHPFLLLPLVALGTLALGGAYEMVLGVGATSLHFVLDTRAPHGFHWWSPFNWRHYTLNRHGISRVPEEKVHAYYESKLAVCRSRKTSDALIRSTGEFSWVPVVALCAAILALTGFAIF